jgi:hypothetical protein
MIRERAAKYLSAKPNLRKMDVQGSSCGAATSLPGRAACQHRVRRRGSTGQIYLTSLLELLDPNAFLPVSSADSPQDNRKNEGSAA